MKKNVKSHNGDKLRDEYRTMRLQVMVTPSMKEAVQQVADAEGKYVSTWVYELLTEALNHEIPSDG